MIKRGRILVILLSISLISGCGRAIRIIREPIPEGVARSEGALIFEERKPSIEKKEEERPEGPLRVGEKFTYSLQWLGLRVGTATLEVKEIVDIKDRRAYHIILNARSNRWLSRIYKVRDDIHTFVDVERLTPLRFESYRREGGYRCREITTYDQDAHIAVQKSLISGITKDIKIPPDTQDVLSCPYYFRTQDIKIGESLSIPVNAREKNYKLETKVLKLEMLRIWGIGTYRVIKVEPSAKSEGKSVKKGKMLIWFTDDKEKIPLFVKIKVPIVGSVYVVLIKIE